MLTLLSFFLGVFVSRFAGWRTKMRRSWGWPSNFHPQSDPPPTHPPIRQTAPLFVSGCFAAAGPGHSCLSVAGREVEGQQQQLLNRQWLLPPATHGGTPCSSSPPPRPSHTGPVPPTRAPLPQGDGREQPSGGPQEARPPPDPGRWAQGARAVNFLSSGLETVLGFSDVSFV